MKCCGDAYCVVSEIGLSSCDIHCHLIVPVVAFNLRLFCYNVSLGNYMICVFLVELESQASSPVLLRETVGIAVKKQFAVNYFLS